MARKQVDGQIDLVDNDPSPEFKAAKRQCKEYDKLKEANKEVHSANKFAEKKKRGKVIEAIQAAKIEPDSEGAYHIQIDDKEWVFSQDSEWKIKKHQVKDETPVDDEGEDEPDDE